MQMADRMSADGYKDAGYSFVNVDVSSLHKMHNQVLLN